MQKKENKIDAFNIKGHVKFTIRDAKTNKIKRIYEKHNLITTVGKTMIANNLTDTSPTNTMVFTHVALGDGNDSPPVVPAVGNTTLDNEVYRKAVSSYTNAAGVAYATGFFDATEVVDTFHEAGLFSNATGAADSGILFSHVALNPSDGIAKSGTETLTIDWTITIT